MPRISGWGEITYTTDSAGCVFLLFNLPVRPRLSSLTPLKCPKPKILCDGRLVGAAGLENFGWWRAGSSWVKYFS